MHAPSCSTNASRPKCLGPYSSAWLQREMLSCHLQCYLFFDSVFGPLMSIATLLLAFIPIIYVFAEYSPCVAPRYAACALPVFPPVHQSMHCNEQGKFSLRVTITNFYQEKRLSPCNCWYCA